jgi:hypothetical protein
MPSDRRIGTRVSSYLDKDKASGQKRDPGPYIGIIKNNADPIRSGRVQVYIPDFGGDETDQSHWISVSYASPYMGAARTPQITSKKSKENDYKHVNHSYGMWFTPPDIGNQVLITFVGGDVNNGYWFACIMPDISHWAIPAQAGAQNLETPIDGNLAAALSKPPYPCVEFNEDNDKLKPNWTNFLEINKPVHENQVEVLLNQGLEDDKIRGVISSSSQRESPSRVFGISTPGVDGKTLDPNTGQTTYRLGGHTFVMDDGDIKGVDQLIRLRSAGGHQILMNDSQNILYIGNDQGTVWMEFMGDGTLNLFAGSDINIRSQSDINLHSDNDINMFANNDINMYSGKHIKQQSDVITQKAITEYKLYGGKVGLGSGSTLNLAAATEGTFGSGTNLVYSSGMIYLNTQGAPSVTPPDNIPVQTYTDADSTAYGKYIKWTQKGKVSSTIPTQIPTHEPSPTHITSPAGKFSKTPGTSPGTPATPSNRLLTSTMASDTAPGPASAKGQGVWKPMTAADLAAQPPNASGIGTLSAAETTALKAQIAKTESGGNYAATGGAGGNYLGKYQVGAGVLIDQGFVKPGTTNSQLSDPSSWTGKDGITSKSAFLSSPNVQESVMDKNLLANFKTLNNIGALDANSISSDVAGKLAASHLVGAGGVKSWAAGNPSADAFGTTASTYYNNGRFAVAMSSKESPSSIITSASQVATVVDGVVKPIA